MTSQRGNEPDHNHHQNPVVVLPSDIAHFLSSSKHIEGLTRHCYSQEGFKQRAKYVAFSGDLKRFLGNVRWVHWTPD